MRNEIENIMRKLLQSLNISENKLIESVIIVYIIGIIGFVIPYTHNFFLYLTPLNLLFCLLALLYLSKDQLKYTHVWIFIVIYLLGYGIEVLGVNTGWPFGEYVYGPVLWVKLMETPLFIGVNWLMLILVTHVIAFRFTKNALLTAIIGALLMLGFDLVLEPFAIATGMWNWANLNVPVENYIAWFIIAFIMHLIMNIKPLNGSFKLALTIFLAQIAFFIFNIMFVL